MHLSVEIEIIMKWIAGPETFVERVTEYVTQRYPKVRPTFDGGTATWSDSRIDSPGLTAMDVVPGDNHVLLKFMPASDSTLKWPDKQFVCEEASLGPIAQAICDWIEARDKALETGCVGR